MSIKPCDKDVFDNGQSVCLVDIPKETAENICRSLSSATGCKIDWHYVGGRVHIKALAAPVVERQPVAEVTDMKYNRVQFYRATGDTTKPYLLPGTKLYIAPPELAELQAAIAQQAVENERNAKNSAEWEAASLHWMAERDQLKAEIERLNGGQGEPVAYQARHSATEPWFFTDKPGYWEWRPVYTSQPAPVAVVLKDHEFRECVNRLRDVALQYRDAQQLRERISTELRACLEKVKELNQ